MPLDLLGQLNRGETEALTVAEWLVVDQPFLFAQVLEALKIENLKEVDRAFALKDRGVMDQMRGMSELLLEVLRGRDDRGTLFEVLANFPSDTVRSWAGYVVGMDESLVLDEKMKRMRRFANDHNMNVRETAWMALRPDLLRDLARSWPLLILWAKDEKAPIRRCAIEAVRPRGVWCSHSPVLRAHPEKALSLLELVKSDPDNYVQRSVANWLNDASKDHPDWVKEVCEKWIAESGSGNTQWIVHHALRTLRKQAKK